MALAVTATLAWAGPVAAMPCLDCEDPELPGPGGGPNCPSISATTDPSLVPGDVQVGVEMRGLPGTWNSHAKSLKYGWVVDNKPVTGNQTDTFVPRADDLGKAVRFKVTAVGTDPQCTKTEYSAQSSGVQAGDKPNPVTLPSVSGTMRVGNIVTAHPGTWSPAADDVTFTWWRGSISVGTGPTHELVAADRGQSLRVSVKATRVGHTSATHQVPLPTITSGSPVQATVAPALVGDLRVGEQVSLSPGTWAPAADDVSFTWWRGDQQIGTGTRHTVVPEDATTPLRVEVLALRAGHEDARSTLALGRAALAAAPPTQSAAPTARVAPRVQGTPVYGSVLRVLPGVWSTAGTETYQWHRSGQPIGGTTSTTYRPVVADLGKRLSVTVRFRAPGRAPVSTALVVGTATPAAAPRWTRARLRLKGRDRLRQKVSVALSPGAVRNALAAPDAKVTYQWLRNGKVLRAQTSRVHRLVRADVRRKLKVRVTVTRPGHRPLVLTTRTVKIRNHGKKIR